jgi:integrase
MDHLGPSPCSPRRWAGCVTRRTPRRIFGWCSRTPGYPWVTSHVYRKTVATLMDAAGLSARQAAGQLGHAKVSVTQDNYFGRKVAQTGAAGVLEMFGDSARQS